MSCPIPSDNDINFMIFKANMYNVIDIIIELRKQIISRNVQKILELYAKISGYLNSVGFQLGNNPNYLNLINATNCVNHYVLLATSPFFAPEIVTKNSNPINNIDYAIGTMKQVFVELDKIRIQNVTQSYIN